ncbi:MAG: hypothetical protein HND47_16640 [Chloroflexi bacterium]|nr:hypothetical protein [Chloroflexota bacterium]
MIQTVRVRLAANAQRHHLSRPFGFVAFDSIRDDLQRIHPPKRRQRQHENDQRNLPALCDRLRFIQRGGNVMPGEPAPKEKPRTGGKVKDDPGGRLVSAGDHPLRASSQT